jgi:hypothetical protein
LALFSLSKKSFAIIKGEPPARVLPYADTVGYPFPALCGRKKGFVLCGGRQEALPLDSENFLKKVLSKTFDGFATSWETARNAPFLYIYISYPINC